MITLTRIDPFLFEELDRNNPQHKKYARLMTDHETKKWLWNIKYDLKHYTPHETRRNYFVLQDGLLQGYLHIGKSTNNSIYLSYAINKEKRGQHVASMLLKNISDYILTKDTKTDQIQMIIDNANLGSQKAAINAGFIPGDAFYHTKRQYIKKRN